VSFDSQQTLEMSDAEYRMFCELVRAHCGLSFDEDSRYLVEKRLQRRVSELALGSFAAYHLHLRSATGDDEMGRVVDLLTTNETYFFRERNQLRALVDEIIPELRLRRAAQGATSPLSIWSAGCSSGEEPYTIVMMAMEAGLVPGEDFRIYASDISRSMLTKSRRGLYRDASFRDTPEPLRERFFHEKDGLYRIADEIKQHVDFIHVNLLDRSKISLLGSIDVILCRNVIIYFDAEVKRTVIGTFYEKLRPGGYLLLGHSESLINVTSAFELSHLENDLVYRKPVAGEERRDPWHEVAAAAIHTEDES